MRTSIFTKFPDLSKDFREDFAVVWNLPENQRLALIPYVLESLKTKTTGERKEVVEKAVYEIGGKAPDLLRAMKSLVFLSREWDPTQDTPENLLKDLGELALIPSERAQEGKRFLLDFLNEIQKDNVRRLHKSYAGSLLPYLESVSTLIDFRAVFEKPFHMGDKIKDYEPRCIGFVPVIVVRMTRSSGDPVSFEFQCEPNDMRLIITQLQAAMKDFETGKLSLPGGTT